MLDAMMDTLETIAGETCRFEPTYQEEDDKITQETRDKSTPEVLKDIPTSAALKKIPRRNNSNAKKGTKQLKKCKITVIDVKKYITNTQVKAQKMSTLSVGETIFIDHIKPVQGPYGKNFIMFTDDDRAFWSNTAATRILNEKKFDFDEQTFIITKIGDQEYEYGYSPSSVQLKQFDKHDHLEVI